MGQESIPEITLNSEEGTYIIAANAKVWLNNPVHLGATRDSVCPRYFQKVWSEKMVYVVPMLARTPTSQFANEINTLRFSMYLRHLKHTAGTQKQGKCLVAFWTNRVVAHHSIAKHNILMPTI